MLVVSDVAGAVGARLCLTTRALWWWQDSGQVRVDGMRREAGEEEGPQVLQARSVCRRRHGGARPSSQSASAGRRAYESGSKRFLFSAVISGGVGYISQHERFPEARGGRGVPGRWVTPDGATCARACRSLVRTDQTRSSASTGGTAAVSSALRCGGGAAWPAQLV